MIFFSRSEISLGPDLSACPQCGGPRLWFHGFVRAFFDGFETGVLLRRLRCPDCKAVHRMRPAGYFKRFQSPVAAIRISIVHRIETGRWPTGSVTSKAGALVKSAHGENFGYSGLIVAPVPSRRSLRPIDLTKGRFQRAVHSKRSSCQVKRTLPKSVVAPNARLK